MTTMTTMTTISTVLVISLIAICVAANDSAKKESEVWAGTGTLYSPDNKPICNYKMRVTLDLIDAQTVKRQVAIEFPDGKNMSFTCIQKGSDELGWQTSCEADGKKVSEGMVLCFQDGICQETSVEPDGDMTTNVIIEPRDGELFLVRTESKHGKVVTIAHDSLRRVSK